MTLWKAALEDYFYSEKVLFQCCRKVLLPRNPYRRYPISYFLFTVNITTDKFNVKANIHIQIGEANIKYGMII